MPCALALDATRYDRYRNTLRSAASEVSGYGPQVESGDPIMWERDTLEFPLRKNKKSTQANCLHMFETSLVEALDLKR